MSAQGEDQFVDWLRGRFPVDSSRVPVGIGDDAAALRWDNNLVVVTADMLLDGVHFDTNRHNYEQIGAKALACSLSDCAAMGCRPRGATVSIAIGAHMSLKDVQSLYEGVAAMVDKYACPLIGGDTTRWPGALAIDVTMLAEPCAARGPILRSTAQAGDTLYVSGPLGGSIVGRHLAFEPRLSLAEQLADRPEVHAMMDISDGLSTDLPRMCRASGCAAELSAELLERVISDEARALADQDGQSPLAHALNDGEDFELLIAGSSGLAELDLWPVGRMTRVMDENERVVLVQADGGRQVVEPKGYEHLR